MTFGLMLRAMAVGNRDADRGKFGEFTQFYSRFELNAELWQTHPGKSVMDMLGGWRFEGDKAAWMHIYLLLLSIW